MLIRLLIGTTFLIVCLIREINFHFTKNHHFGFEAAAWYCAARSRAKLCM